MARTWCSKWDGQLDKVMTGELAKTVMFCDFFVINRSNVVCDWRRLWNQYWVGARDTNDNVWYFTSSDSVLVSGERGFWRSTLKSPVMVMVLYVTKKGSSVSCSKYVDMVLRLHICTYTFTFKSFSKLILSECHWRCLYVICNGS